MFPTWENLHTNMFCKHAGNFIAKSDGVYLSAVRNGIASYADISRLTLSSLAPVAVAALPEQSRERSRLQSPGRAG